MPFQIPVTGLRESANTSPYPVMKLNWSLVLPRLYCRLDLSKWSSRHYGYLLQVQSVFYSAVYKPYKSPHAPRRTHPRHQDYKAQQSVFWLILPLSKLDHFADSVFLGLPVLSASDALVATHLQWPDHW